METRLTDRANIKQSAFSKVRKQRKKTEICNLSMVMSPNFRRRCVYFSSRLKSATTVSLRTPASAVVLPPELLFRSTILTRIHVFRESRSNIFRRASMTGLWQRLRSWL